MEDEQIKTDCNLCTIEQDLFIRLCPKHKAADFMLEALRLIVYIIPDGNSPSHLKAKAAIAKAEERT